VIGSHLARFTGEAGAPAAARGQFTALLPFQKEVSGTRYLDMTIMMVLNALQSLAAVGALLFEIGVLGSVESDGVPDYSAYARLAQAYQVYAAQYQQAPVPRYDAAGQATGHVQADATAGAAPAGTDAARESFAALQARYARHGLGGRVQQSSGSAGARSVVPVADTGVAGANRGVSESDRYRGHENSGGSIIEPSGL